MFANNTLILKNEMTTYKITPDFSVSNTKNEVLTNVFSNLYESMMSRISLTNINIRRQNQVHFNIVMENRNVSFYLSFPSKFEELIEGKIKSCWKKCALDEVQDTSHLKVNTVNTVGAELRLTNYNINPINTDLNDTSHLTSLLQVLRAVSGEDKIVINIAMESMPRYNWYSIVEDENKMIKEGKEKMVDCDFTDMLKKTVGKVGNEAIGLYIEYKLLPFEILLGMVNDSGDELFNIKEEDRKMLRRYEQKEFDRSDRFDRFERRRTPGLKKNSDVFKCKITILSCSEDTSKAKLNLLSVFESFKELNDENEFYLKELPHRTVISRTKDIQSYYVSTDNNCILSAKEVAKLIQLPPQKTQKDFKIKAIETLEVDFPKENLDGDVPIAVTKQNGKEVVVYRPKNKSMRSLGWILNGAQNAGKTTLMKRLAYENYLAGETNLIIDSIEDCKIAKACREVIPANKRYDIKLTRDDIKNIPSFSFNEVSGLIHEGMDSFKRLSYASDIAEQIQLLIENISDGTNGGLTDAMVRYLYSASVVAYVKPDAVLQDVFNILRVPDKRAKAIQYAKNTGCFDDDSIFLTLCQLDKVVEEVVTVGVDDNGKPIKEKQEYTINNDQAIVGINNRIIKLEKEPYVKKMLAQRPKKDENFLDFIEQGISIVVSIPQYEFKSKQIRDMIASYYLSRIWLAVQSRRDNENAKICNVFMDEVYTIPASIKLLDENVTEFRRHRLPLFTSCHHLGQFGKTLDQFEAAGGNFIFLQSTIEKTYEMVKNDLTPFTYNDIRELKPFHAIIRQRDLTGYTNYIARIPDFGEDLTRQKENNKQILGKKKRA